MEAFSLKKSCQNAERSGSRLVRGQVNMVVEAKFCSPIRSTLEAWVALLQPVGGQKMLSMVPILINKDVSGPS